MALQHLRSSIANKRPVATSLSDGQLAINTNAASPGVFFTNSSNVLSKVGPIHIGTSAPNSSPAGSSGNATGEQWLDTSGANKILKVWDGTTWVTAVQIEDSISSTSTTSAATPNAVKTAYDLANGALPKAGGTISGNIDSTATGYFDLPTGTTAQRPGTANSGMIRYNSDIGKFEGYTTAWGSIGGGATGAGGDDVFYENGQTVTTSYTLTTNKNAMSAGPITINSGATVTIPSGASWTIV